MFSFKMIVPTPILQPYVERYVLYEVDADGEVVQNLVPSNMQNIGFILKGTMRSYAFKNHSKVSRSYVLGQMSTPISAIYCGSVRILAIHFHSSGMYQLFEIPMDEFTNLGVDFELLVHADEKPWIERIFESEQLEEQIELIETVLIRRLPGNKINSDLSERIQHAGNLIVNQCGNISVKGLAGEVNMCERNFERHFIQKVGVPPKMFAGIARMKKAMEMIEQKPNLTWKDITYSLQYTDQAHFINDFKKFSGRTPGEYWSTKTDFERFLYSF